MAKLDSIVFLFSKSWFLFSASFNAYSSSMRAYFWLIKVSEFYFLHFYKADFACYKFDFKSLMPSSINSMSLKI